MLLGAGFVIFTPPPGVGPASYINTVRDIALTADDVGSADLLAPWIDQYNTASENATTLLNNFVMAPGVAFQQMLANMSGYVQDFFDDPSSNSVAAINVMFQDNLAAMQTAYGLQGATTAETSTVLKHTLDGTGTSGHLVMFNQIPGYLPADQAPLITPIINFLGSPASGILMGEIGPWISPWVALMNSLTDGDDFNTTMANMVGAFFNGATLNLDSLLPAINGAGVFPLGMAMQHLDIGFGGLLSTGSVSAAPYVVGDTTVPAVGGSIFNSIGLDFSGVPVLGTLDIPSQPIGPLGAWEGWAETLATLLGWDSSGSPLAGIDLPIIPDGSFDDGGAAGSAAADAATSLQDLIAGLFS